MWSWKKRLRIFGCSNSSGRKVVLENGLRWFTCSYNRRSCDEYFVSKSKKRKEGEWVKTWLLDRSEERVLILEELMWWSRDDGIYGWPLQFWSNFRRRAPICFVQFCFFYFNMFACACASTSDVRRQTSGVRRQTSDVRRQTSDARRQTSVVSRLRLRLRLRACVCVCTSWRKIYARKRTRRNVPPIYLSMNPL